MRGSTTLTAKNELGRGGVTWERSKNLFSRSGEAGSKETFTRSRCCFAVEDVLFIEDLSGLSLGTYYKIDHIARFYS